jgi:Domain of unknown function (DUF5658)
MADMVKIKLARLAFGVLLDEGSGRGGSCRRQSGQPRERKGSLPLSEGTDTQVVKIGRSGRGSELRAGGDRRRKTLPPLRYWIAGGRRRSVRRLEDSQRIVLLDRYSPKLFGAIIGILCLSLLDAILTLYLVEHGSSELNPVMDYFLKKGPLIFTVAKYILTSIAVIIFLVLANSVVPRSKFRAKKLFPYALIAFGSVIAWELILILLLVTRV